MTATDTHLEPLHAVAAAGDELVAAKRTRSEAIIECAERELQHAVDAARDLDIEWGPIGSALGIARGNAYQRFRRRPAVGSLQAPVGRYRYPPL